MLIHLSILTIYNQFNALISRPKHKLAQIVRCGVDAMVATGVTSTSGRSMCHQACPVTWANIWQDVAGGERWWCGEEVIPPTTAWRSEPEAWFGEV